MNNELLTQLARPFHPSHVTWKPGAVKGDRALALAYADVRAYMNRLDEVCGSEWSITYEPWGEDRIICKLTIAGTTRSSTGETTNESEKSEIGGTVAEAQAFKRACAMFGLGRYLYNLPTGWADFDPATKRFTEKAKARLMGILTQHYRRATGDSAPAASDSADVDFGTSETVETPPNNDAPATSADNGKVLSKVQLSRIHALGMQLHPAKGKWDAERPRYVEWATKGAISSSKQLNPDEADALIAAMERKLKAQPKPAQPVVVQNGVHA